MITLAQARTMARYNAWQNQWIFAAADGLDPAAREADRGAFFGSIRATLSHLMWGDLVWMARFEGTEPPAGGIGGSAALFDWSALMAGRPTLDARIAAWAWSLGAEDPARDLRWVSGVLGREVVRPLGLCAAHMFNHQTHHRGQVHAMLTAAGAPTGTTDLFALPDDVPGWR